jgi:D-alanyl-D-alanine carboxypeptidase
MPSDPQQNPDAADWRPRNQPPAPSYTSFRELREKVRRETGQQPIVMPPLPAHPADSVPPTAPITGQRPTIIVLPGDASTSKLGTGPTATVKGATGQTQTVKVAAPTVHIRPDAPRVEGTEDKGRGTPTAQQRISAIITAVVGIIAIVVLVVRPFVADHLPPGFAAGAAGFTTPPTPLPVYPSIGIDTDHPAPLIWATSGVVMDESNGAILFSKNGDLPLAMASTTKLMTAVVALSHGSPDQSITISANASSIFCTCVGIKKGEQYSLHDLLYGMLMISGNDAAEAIAEGVGGGSEATFIKWMNDTAGALGLTHTHYMNPHGLDDSGHYSSARDLAVLGRYALQLPTIAGILATRTFTIPATNSHPKHDLVNQHQPLWWYPGADGGKPGWTGEARFVDVLSAVRNGHHLIAAIMHSDNDWVTDIRDMLNWGFNDFTWVSPHDVLSHGYIPYADAYGNFTWDVPSRVVIIGGREYFPYTGYILADPFLSYFNKNGGIDHFGFPRGMPIPAANGQLTQHFDKLSITCNPVSGTCTG